MRTETKAAGLILILAAALRFYAVGDVFPVEEEFQQIYTGLHPATLAGFLALLRQNPHLHMLVDPLSLFIMGRMGDSLSWLRLPSVLWGIAGVAGMLRLGRHAQDKRLGLYGALLLAVSLLHIDWSRRADFYSLLAALSIWSTDAFFAMRKDPRRWKSYCAWGTVFLYAHPYAVILALLHGAFLALEKDRRAFKSYLRAGAWALLALAPWCLYAFSASVDDNPFDFSAVPGNLSIAAFLARIPLYFGQAPEAGPFRVWGFTAAAGVSAAYFLLYLDSLASRKADPLLRFCQGAALLGTLAVTALDLWYGYYLSHRQLLWVLPFYLLAVADGARRWVGRLALEGSEPVLAAVLIGLTLPIFSAVTRFQTDRTGEERHIVGEVERRARPGDVLAFQHDGLLMSFLYYFDRAAFAAVPDMRLVGKQNAHMTFLIPDGFRARRGAADVEVKVSRGEEKGTGWWTFRGSLYDLWVYPPSGR